MSGVNLGQAGGWGMGTPLVVNTNDLMESTSINKADIHEDVFLKVLIDKKEMQWIRFL
jgi:hypothetical protein